MKQHITEEQLQEITREQIIEYLFCLWKSSNKEQVAEYYDAGGVSLGAFSIGVMIEFIDRKNTYRWMGFDFKDSTVDTFCDDLWETVKGLLK